MDSLPYVLALIAVALSGARAFQLFRASVDVEMLSGIAIRLIGADNHKRLMKLLDTVPRKLYAQMVNVTVRAFETCLEHPETSVDEVRTTLLETFMEARDERLTDLAKDGWLLWGCALCVAASFVVGGTPDMTHFILSGLVVLLAWWSMRTQSRLVNKSLGAGQMIVHALVASFENRAVGEAPGGAVGDSGGDREMVPIGAQVVSTNNSAPDSTRGSSFEIHEPGARPRCITIDRTVIKVGKLDSSHMCLQHDSVSRMHAVIEVRDDADEPEEIVIIDLGSTRGTTVNGQKINTARLRPGDHIGFGDVRAIFLGQDVGGNADGTGRDSAGESAAETSDRRSLLEPTPASVPPVPRPGPEPDSPGSTTTDEPIRLADLRTASCPVCGHDDIAVSGPLYAMPSPRPLIGLGGDPVGPFTAYVCAGCGYCQWFTDVTANPGLQARDKRADDREGDPDPNR